METVATLPSDLGLIPIAEALKSATSRTGGKPNVIARGPEPCSPGISRARSRIGPVALLQSQFFPFRGVTPVSTPLRAGKRTRLLENHLPEGRTATGPDRKACRDLQGIGIRLGPTGHAHHVEVVEGKPRRAARREAGGSTEFIDRDRTGGREVVPRALQGNRGPPGRDSE